MPRAGRRRSVVWTCFVENAESGKRRVFCRFCHHDIVANPIRMVRHIVKHCPDADEHHKKICREYQTLTVPLRRRGAGDTSDQGAVQSDAARPMLDAATTASSPLPASEIATTSPAMGVGFNLVHAPMQLPIAGRTMDPTEASHPPPSPQNGATLVENVASLPSTDIGETPLVDPGTVDRAHEGFILALASSGTSLHLMEHPHFRQALRLLGMPDLSMEDIAHHVVSRLRGQMDVEAHTRLRSATSVTVQVTGITRDGSLQFLAADQDHHQDQLDVDVSGDEQDIKTLIRKCLDGKPRKAQCPIHLCVDAFGEVAGSAVFTQDQPEPTKEPGEAPMPVLVARCMMQASLSLFADVAENVAVIRRTVEACTELHAMLRIDIGDCEFSPGPSSGTKERVLPTARGTPFWTMVSTLGDVLQHERVLRASVPEWPEGVKPHIDRDQFWAEAKLVENLLRPFAFLVALSKGGHLASSIIVVAWLLVWATAETSDVLNAIEKSAVASSVVAHIGKHGDSLALVSLLLDPRCRGLGLSTHGKRKARTMVIETAVHMNPHVAQVRLLEQVAKFLNSERPFEDVSWDMMASLPRLFWVDYMSEAHELAFVALEAVSFRPYIHSLDQTWEACRAASDSSSRQQTTAGDDYESRIQAVLRRRASLEKQMHAFRKEVVEAAGRVLDPRVPASSIPSLANAKDLPVEPPNQFWAELSHVANALFRDDRAASESAVDTSWFAIDSRDAVTELHACLRRALFGDVADFHGSLVAPTNGSVVGADVGSVETVVAEETSDMLSDLVEL